MPEKMSQTDAVLYTIDRGKATIDHCLKHGDTEMRAVIRREWLVTVGATLDTARAEVEALRGLVAEGAALVEAREWNEVDYCDMCGCCDAHVPGCRVAAFLAAAKGVEP